MIDLVSLTIAELQSLVDDAKKRIADLERSRLADLRYSLEAQARAAGFDVADLFPKLRSKTGPTPTPRSVKYRNPSNPSEVWGGMGKRPSWLRDALAAGKALTDFETSR
jgi:DNA-binding protein H-NS